MDKMYLSKIVQGGNTLYIKDSEAREAISALEAYSDYVGVTTTALTDGSTVNPIVVGGETITVKKGNIANYGSKEFIFNGTAWQEFGDLSALGALAYEDTAVGSVTAVGSNAPSAVSFTAHTTASFISGVDSAAVAPSFTEGAFDEGTLPSFTEGAFTPASLGTGFVTAGTAATYSHSGFSGGSLGSATTGSFATEGVTATYSESNETLTLGSASISSAVTAQGSFTPAVYGTDSFNGGTPTAIDVTKFNGGSKAADTFSAGTLPSKAADTFNAGSAATFNTASAITALGTATAAAQTFTGSPVSVTVAPAA